MENQFFLNGEFEAPSSMPIWQSLSSSSAMEIQPPITLLNSSSDHQNQQDCFFTPTTTTDHHHHHHHSLHFDSALSSIVSSPASSPNDNFVMRELIGKLGTVVGTNSCGGEISPHSYMNNNTKMALNSNNVAAEFSAADPGFVERAAKFSCFGSRSFNDNRRRTQLVVMNNNAQTQRSAATVIENGKLSRVSSSPSLKTFGSQMEKNKNSPLQEQERMEVANSQEESTISDQNTPNGGETGVKTSNDMTSRKRKASSSKGKASNSSNPTKGVESSVEDLNAKRSKPNEGDGNENDPMKMEEESKGVTTNAGEEKQNKSNSKPPEPPKDYIHVRARRGQATDSHSLAERVRREKISERMKLLQDLVPGCNKVTGKALMLDEIINYVQSLQRQVEFLSMKLASVNTRMDLSIESVISKDIFQSNNNSLQQPIFPLDSSAPSFYGHQPQQNPAILNNMPNRTVTHCSVDPLDSSSFLQNLGMHLPLLNGFNDGASQFPLTFSEDDLHTIVQMGFGQTENRKTPMQSPNFNGSNQASQMKVEL